MSSERGRNLKYHNSRSNKNHENDKDDSGNRYDLRTFIRGKRKFPKYSNGNTEDIKPDFNTRKSWADMCEEYEEKPFIPKDENSVSTPLKNLSMDSPAKDRYFSRSIEKDEENNGHQVVTRSNKKRDRNVAEGDNLNFIPISPNTEGVKRRLGWSRTKFSVPDNVSTTSSSTMYSSDNEMDGERSSTKQYETDPEVLRRRQKQIDYGKNTKGYRLYLQAIPKFKRQPHDIFTPKKHIKYSRRSWDSQIKIWRKRLHIWDDKSDEEEEADVDLSEMAALVKTEPED